MEHGAGTLTGQGGLKVFYQYWRPVAGEAAGGGPVPLVLAHGLSEHSDRYAHVAEYFAQRGHPVWALDHRGHGRSEGVRVYVDRFDDYLYDLGRFVDLVREAESRRKPVLVGHSMGGVIALAYALSRPETLAGLVLSSPWLGLNLRPPLHLRLLLPVLSTVAPRMAVPNDALTTYVCRDPEILQRYVEDPMRCRTATPRWFREAVRAQARVRQQAPSLQLPVLFLVAGDDRLVDAGATQAIYEALSSPKRWHLYPEMYHEVFNDPDREQVLQDLHRWLVDQHLAVAAELTP